TAHPHRLILAFSMTPGSWGKSADRTTLLRQRTLHAIRRLSLWRCRSALGTFRVVLVRIFLSPMTGLLLVARRLRLRAALPGIRPRLWRLRTVISRLSLV